MPLKVIYEPKGRAGEYASLALNHYIGCGFGCFYCSSPLVMRKKREEYHNKTAIKGYKKDKDDDYNKIEVVKNLLNNIRNDCKVLKQTNDKRRVLLSFISDPYQDIDTNIRLTRKILEIFKEFDVNFEILTKGGIRATRDFDLYKAGDAFACTLTFDNDSDSANFEPKAEFPESRMSALKIAKEKNIETWVSLEPVIIPTQSLNIIRLTHEYVDLYKVGTLNYDKLKGTIDWKDFGYKAIELLEKLGKKYYIKEDLKKFL